MTEFYDQLAAVFIVIVLFFFVGFFGWLTFVEDEPIRYEIQQKWMGDNPKGVRT